MSISQNAIDQAHDLLNSLPQETDWERIAYHMEVRASIERGMVDVKAGRVHTTGEVLEYLGIEEE